MVCNVHHWNHCALGLGRHHVAKVPLINLYIHIECFAKGGDFHVVSPGATAGHLQQVVLELSVDFFSSRGSIIKWCRERSSVLSFRVSSHSASRVDLNELLVVRGILTHIFDYARAKLAVLGLIPIHLIREGIEETVAYNREMSLAT